MLPESPFKLAASGSEVPPTNPQKGRVRWLIVISAVIVVLAGLGYAASNLLAHKSTASASPTPTPSPQAPITASERAKVSDNPVPNTQLDVTALSAQNADLVTLLAKALQVSADAIIQGNLTALGNGTFGGNLSAANFSGNGSGLTGVDAALLGGKPGSYYSGLASNLGNAALLSAPNGFTAANSFNAGLASAGITDTGALNVSGTASLGGTTTISSLILGSPLSVPNGGTGVTSVPAAAVLYGQGGPTLGVATPGAAGLCLLSGASDVQWGSCSGAAAGVATLDNLAGVLTLANSSGSGATVTIDNATNAAKGIASFNATNFSVVAGAVNTAQNIATTSAPTFAGLTLTSALTVASGGTGAVSLANNGVVIGGGTNPLTSVTAGSPNLCLISTAGAPVWAACTGGAGGGVTTLDNLAGVLTVNNSTGSGSAITINDASTAQKGIAQFNATNFTAAGGVVNTIQDIATTSAPAFGQLSLSSSQAANPMLTVNNTNAAATGNLIDLKLANTSKFSVTPAGNATFSGTISSGAVNGQTISNAAAFTGTLGVTGLTSLNGGATVVGTLTANTITPTAAMTVGATGQALTLQGNASTQFTATGGGFTTTLAFTGSPTGAVTYNFDRSATSGSYTVCSTAGNCSGAGGGVTTSGGTANKLAKFTAAQGIGNSSITDTGTSVSLTPSSDSASVFQVQNAAGRSLLNVDTSGNKITLGNITASAGQGIAGALVLADGTNDNFGATFSPATLTANHTITVPNAGGTIAVSAAGPLALDAAGNLTCSTCLTSGGGGGTAGVNSLDTLTGALTIANSTGSSTTITINDAKADGATKGIAAFNATNFTAASGVINTIQDIATTSAPTFGQLTLTSSQAANPMLVVNNTNAAGTGNLIDLQLNGSSKFSVSPAGATTIGSSLNVNGNTQFGGPGALGKVSIQGTAAQIGLVIKAQAGQTASLFQLLDSSNNVNAAFGSGGNALTLGTIAGSGTVTQGQLILADGTTDNFGGTLQAATLTASRTYTLPDATGTICLTIGNCAGSGTGVTTAGGTTNKLAKFTAGQAIGDSSITDTGALVTAANPFDVNTNSTTALNIEQNGVHNNVLTVDTTNGTVGINQAPATATALAITGLTQSSSFLASSGTNANNFSKNYIVGTGGVTANDVVVLVDDGGNSRVIDTTTARDPRVMGVARNTISGGTVDQIVVLGNTTVTADTAAVAIGDQLITSATSGQVTVDNNATTGVLGYATSAKAGGSSGTVGVYVHPVNGVTNPTIPGTLTVNTITPSAAFNVGATGQAFTLQGNASSTISATGGGFATTLGFTGSPVGAVTYNFDRAAAAGSYTVCSTAGNCVGTGGAGAAIGGSGTTNKIAKFTAAGTIGNSSITDTGSSISVQPGSDSATAFQVQNAAGTNTLLNIDTTNSGVAIGSTGGAGTITLGQYNGSGTSTINIGNNAGGSTTQNINIGNAGSGTTNLALGSTGGNSATTIQADSGGVSINTGALSGVTGAITIQTGNSSAGASGNITIDAGTNVASGSQVANYTFESSTNNMGCWFGCNTPVQSPAQHHGGTQSLAVTETNAAWATKETFANGPTVTPGHMYAFSAWMRANTTTETIYGAVCWDGAVGGCPEWNVGVTDTNSGWTQITGNLVAPALAAGQSTEYAEILLGDGSGANGLVQYFDDVTISDLGNVTSPSVTLGATNAQTVTIGNQSEGGYTNLYGGVNGINVQAATGGLIGIGTSNTNDVNIGAVGGTANSDILQLATSTGAGQTIQIGGTGVTSGSNSSTVVNAQAGQTNLSLANAGATVQTFTNSTTALQVQNATGTSLLGIDTANSQETIGTSATNTFGNTSSGTNTLSGIYWDGGTSKQGLTAQEFTTAGGGALSSLSAYVGASGISGTHKLYQMAVYSDNAGQPGTYIASTAVGSIGSAGWNTLPITATLSPKTTYWLVYWTNVNDNSNNGVNYFILPRSTTNAVASNTFETWQCTSGCGASTNGMPNTYPTGGLSETSDIETSIYASFAANLPAIQYDSSGNSIQSGNALFQAAANSSSALLVNTVDNQPVLQVDTTFKGVGINAAPNSNWNLNVSDGGNGNGGGEGILGDSNQALDVIDGGNTSIFNVNTLGSQVGTADLTVGDSVSNLNGAGLIVSDNFESGNYSLWSGGSSGGASVDTSQHHSGRYSAEINLPSSTTGYARTSFSSSSTTFTANMWLRWHTLPGSGELPILTLYQASTPTNKVQLYIASDWHLGVINGTTDLGEAPNDTVTNDTWTPVSLTINNSTGVITIAMGRDIWNVDRTYTGLTIGTGWDTLQLGASTASTGQYWVDDLAFGTGSTPALSNGLTVQDSLHTGGSASFGGQVLVQNAGDTPTAFQVQNAAGSNLLTVDTLNSTVNLGAAGSTALATTTNVGTSTSAAQTVNVGSTNGASSTTIQGGTSGITVATGAAASGNSGSIVIKTGDASSGTSGNLYIDNGSGNFNSGTSALNDTFEASPCSSLSPTDFINWFGNSSVVGSNAQAHGGSCSLAATESATDGDFWGITNLMTVIPGEQYVFSAWVRAGSLAQNITGQVGWLTGGASFLQTVTDSTSGWTHITGTAVAPAGATTAYIEFTNNGDGNASSTTYFDDITATANAGAPAIDIGTSNAQTINIGNSRQQGATTVKSGSSGVNVQSSSVTAFQVQNSSGAGLFTVDTSTPGVSIGAVGSSTLGSTIHIADTTDGTGVQGVTIGSNANAANSVTLDSGSSGTINIGTTNTNHYINIGTGNAATALTLGTEFGGSTSIFGSASPTGLTLATALNGSISSSVSGAGIISLTSGNTTSGTVVGTTTDSTGAFQVQNAGSGDILNVDTTNEQVTLGRTTGPTALQEWDTHGTNQATVPDSPSHVGDLIVLAVGIKSTTPTVSSVSGGGVTTWNFVHAHNDATDGIRSEIWEGVVTTAGAGTITVTYSSTPGAACELVAQELSAGANTTWGVVTSGDADTSSSSTVTFPTLTATASGQIYWGYMWNHNGGVNGSTAGFSYKLTSAGDNIAYDGNLSAGSYTPTASQGGAGYSTGSAVIFSAYTSGTGLTVNGGETIDDVNSTTAFQVQNAAGTNLITADTTNMRISVGSAGTATGQLYVSGSVPTAAVSTTTLLGDAEGLYVQGKYAYVVDSVNGRLQTYDVSNPASPTSVSTLNLASNTTPRFVTVEGNYAYIALNQSNQMQIVDVSNPASPVSLSTISTGTGPRGIAIQSHYAYVVNDNNGGGGGSMQVFDVSNPAAPVQLGSNYSTNISTPKADYIQGRILYIANASSAKVAAVDISNPASPSQIGLSAAMTAPHGMTVAGRYVYVADFSANALKIIDESTPASPSIVGSVSTGASSSPQGVYVQGRYAYVVDGNSNNMQVIDVSNPASPAIVGTITTGTDPYNVMVVGRYAYVIDESGQKLQIFDTGGTYSQQLESGGTETGTLEVDNNALIQNNLDVRGGLEVANGAQLQGSLNVSGTASFTSTTNSASAFQVQNSSGSSLINADTTTQYGNLISNPGGEVAITSSDWPSAGFGTGVTVSRTTATAWSGAGAISVATTGSANSGAKNVLTATLADSTAYSLSFYAKASGSNFSTLAVDYLYDGSTTDGTVSCTGNSPVTGGWTRFTCGFTTSSSSHAKTSSNAIVIYQTDSATRTFYIDGVQLKAATTTYNSYGGSGALRVDGVITSPLQLQNTEDSTTAFRIQGSGAAPVFNVDTNNARVVVGDPASTVSTAKLYVAGPGGNTAERINNNSNGNILELGSSGSTQDFVNFDGSMILNNTGSWTGSGTVTTNGTTTVTGSSTKFLSAVKANDILSISGDSCTVASVGGDASLTCTATVPSHAGVTYTITPGTTGGESGHSIVLDANGQVGIGTSSPTAALEVDGNGLFKNANNSTTAFQVQNASTQTLFGVDTSGSNVNLGATGSLAVASAVNIATSTGASQTVHVADTSSETSTVTVGSLSSTSATTIQAGSGNLNLNTNSSSASIIAKSSTNSASALQVQNAAGVAYLNVDTTAGSTNLVTNGSFETDTAGNLPSGWSLKGSDTVTASTGQYVFGKQSLDASTTATGGDGAKYNLTLANSTAYSLSFYASSNAAFGTFNYGYSSDGSTEDAANISATAQTLPTLSSSGWIRFNLNFTTPGSHSGTPYLYFKQSDATARHIYLDGVDIEQTTGQAYYKEGALQVNGNITSPLTVQTPENNNASFNVIDQNGTRVFTVDTRDARLGINTVNPTGELSFGATSAGGGTRTINIQGSNGNGDTLQLTSNNGNGSNKNGGGIGLTTGNASGSAAGGTIALLTGTSATGTTGGITLTTGNASGAGTAGSITLQTGSTVSGTAGGVLVKPASGGDSTTALQVQNSIGSVDFSADTTSLNSLINNPSEESTDNSNWANYSGTGTPTRDCGTQSQFGSCSEKIVLGTGNTDSVKYTTSSSFAANPYVLSFYLKQTTGDAITTASSNLTVGYNNGSDHTCSIQSPSFSAQNPSSSGWVRYQCSFTTTGTSTFLFWKQVDTPGVARTLWIDGLQMEQTSNTTAKAFQESGISQYGVINSALDVRPTNDSTVQMQVQNSAGTTNILTLDSLNGKAIFGNIVTNTTGNATQVLIQANSGNRGLVVEDNGTQDALQIVNSSGTNVSGIDASGNFVPGADNARALGTATLVFNKLYTAGVDAGTTTTTLGLGATNATAITIGGNTSGTLTEKFANSSTTAAVLQTAGGTNYLTLDTTNERIYIGPTAGDTVGALLVLGNKTNAGDPTGVAGAMYYNSNTGSFRCYSVDHWENCLQDARSTFHYQDDMLTQGDSTVLIHGAAGTGAAWTDNFASVASHPGILKGTTGSTNAGDVSMANADFNDQFLLGGGDFYRHESDLKLPTLSTGTQRYIVATGFGDANNADPTNGCQFKYSDNVNGGKWLGICDKAGTQSTCDTASTSGTTVAAATWYRLTISANSAGTSVDFQVNGSTTNGSGRCQITTNIPTVATGFATYMLKTVGTTASEIDVDYIDIYGDFGTSR